MEMSVGPTGCKYHPDGIAAIREIQQFFALFLSPFFPVPISPGVRAGVGPVQVFPGPLFPVFLGW